MLDRVVENKILDFITSSREPIHSTEIANALGINRVTTTKYLSVLHSRGLIEFKSLGMAKVWMPVENPLLLPFERNDVNNTTIQALNSLADGVCVLDRDLNIVWFNAQMEKRHGKLGKVKGDNCFKVFHNESRICENCPTKKTFETGKSAHVSIQKKGQTIDLSTAPLKNKRGKTVAVIETVRVMPGRPTVMKK
jgi:transcriptional regulator with PAS, ATPase and Fis domain